MSSLDELFGLAGRIAVVTGASSGLGKSFAHTLARAGAGVALAARRRDRIEELAAELEPYGNPVLALPCDVASDADVQELVREVQSRLGGIDVLVNNAGISVVSPAEQEALPDFERVLDVNLRGTFACAQAVGRGMLERGRGSIINIASILGLVGCGQIPQAAYAASKGAVVNLTRELGAQWARRGVRVNAIAPGWFPSEMTAEMFASAGSQAWIKKRCPMGRAGEPHELAGALLLLASDASSYITGQTLVVDGGWTAI